jgi:RNA polymerase sigma-70 factor (ECF subfamily)
MTNSTADSSHNPAPGLFPATAWTLVQRAVEGANAAQQAALNELLDRYWRPIYVYLRRTGRPVAEAEDLTQAFFMHLLEKHLLERVRLRQVRFRAYLRNVLEHFLANQARLAGAQKRCGGRRLDIEAVEGWLQAHPAEAPETAFDGAWAQERLESAVRRLRQELAGAGRTWVADALLRRAGFGTGSSAVCDLSREFGASENQMSVAMHRARERLRELILEEVRDSVGSADEAAAELGEMFAILRRRG